MEERKGKKRRVEDWTRSGDNFHDRLVLVLEKEAQPQIEFPRLEGPFFPQPSWGVRGMGAEGVNREQGIPIDGQLRQWKKVEAHLGPA